MVSRSLTEVFVLMRNNAIHSRNLFSESGYDNDHEGAMLMKATSDDVEAGLDMRIEVNPPIWTDSLEEAHYIISRLKTKISELQSRHDRQIRRPALDDSGEQQHIERLAADIGKHFTQAHARITNIKSQVRHGNKSEQKLANNVVLALVTALQDLSIIFRTAQSNYLKSLTSREERSKAYFDLPNFEELSLNDNDLEPGLTNNQTDLLFSLPSTSSYEDETQQKQLLLMEEENTAIIAEREQEKVSILVIMVLLIVLVAARPNEFDDDEGQEVDRRGEVPRVQIKVYRGPTKHDGNAPWGFWVKQPSDDK
ncbi:syntaxin-16 isoform X2 [Pieris brassicae]|uniref:syntaxin-16 isoform X2 n=1 Tax=Pieris brassicae TaxID=7116 RepID=UPI001E65F707|nr:syntaxin-16 isoform X2 [Pieris brassicae]